MSDTPLEESIDLTNWSHSALREEVQRLRAEKSVIGSSIYEIHSMIVPDPLQADNARTFSEALHELGVAAVGVVALRAELAAEKQRADALEAALRRVITALLKLSERGEEGKILLLGNPLKYEDCYFAWLGLNHALCDAKDLLLDAARKPVPQEPKA